MIQHEITRNNMNNTCKGCKGLVFELIELDGKTSQIRRVNFCSALRASAKSRYQHTCVTNTKYIQTPNTYILSYCTFIYIYIYVYMYTVIYQTCTEYVQSFPCTLRSCTCRKSKLHASCWLGHITCSTAGSKLILSCITTRPVVWGHLINYNQLTLKKNFRLN